MKGVKAMRKTMFMLLAAALFVVAGCKKDDKTTEGEKMTFNAGFDNGNAKTEINGLDMSWNEGDAVMINGKTFTADKGGASTTLSGEKTYQEGGLYKAYFPASMYDNGTLTLPATQTYNGKNLSGVNPMYAQSESTNLTFSNLCAMVKLQLTGSKTVKEIRVNADQPLSGEFEIAESGSNFKAVMKSQTGKPGVTLNCGDGVDLSTSNVFYVALPEGDYTNLKFFVVTTDNMCTSIDIAEASFEANVLRELVREPEFHTIVTPTSVTITAGCVNCTYTVSGKVTVPSGSHVCEFGLVYSETDETPTIEEGALKIVAHTLAEDAINGTVNFDADLSTLTDGKSYYVRAYALCDYIKYSTNVKTVIGGDGPNPLSTTWINGKNQHPFTVASGKVVYFSQGNLQYIGSAASPYWKFADHQFDFFGTTTGQNSAATNVDRDLFGWGDLTGCNTSETITDYSWTADWGTMIGSGWRTLTKAEWDYLASTRANASNLYGTGKIGNCNPIKGIIILPDDWDWTNAEIAGFASEWTSGTSTANVFTYSDWSKMEKAGALFLPSAGYRGVITDGHGYYWAANKHNGHYAYVFLSDLYYTTYRTYNNGLSVRLVSDSPN